MKNILFLSFILLLASCQKVEGPGGKAGVRGKIYVKNYNDSFTQLEAEYYGYEENVYIIYGDNEVYGDDMKTNYDGTFEFKFLTKGKYTVFVYSKDSTLTVPGGKQPIFIEFEINDNNEIVDLGEITIID